MAYSSVFQFVYVVTIILAISPVILGYGSGPSVLIKSSGVADRPLLLAIGSASILLLSAFSASVKALWLSDQVSFASSYAELFVVKSTKDASYLVWAAFYTSGVGSQAA